MHELCILIMIWKVSKCAKRLAPFGVFKLANLNWSSSCLCILHIFKSYLHNVLKHMITRHDFWHNYFNSIHKAAFPKTQEIVKINFNYRTQYHKKIMCTCKSLSLARLLAHSLSVSLAFLLTLAPLPQNVANRRKEASVGHQERWVRKWWWYSSTHSHTQLRCGYVTCSHFLHTQHFACVKYEDRTCSIFFFFCALVS